MKKVIFRVTTVLIVLAIVCVALNATNSYQTTNHPKSKGGKWVAEYGGGSSPFRCKCVEHMLISQCVVGDLSGDLSLCE